MNCLPLKKLKIKVAWEVTKNSVTAFAAYALVIFSKPSIPAPLQELTSQVTVTALQLVNHSV
jgi:hypothetical protein